MSDGTRGVNWRQLGLELVMVVGGILIALAIDSWWSERQARRLEHTFLEQLVVDLEQAEERLANSVLGSQVAAQSVVSLMKVSRGETTAPFDSIAAWVNLAGWWDEFRVPLSSAQVLASSEGLFVVRNPLLRGRIVGLLDQVRYTEARALLMEERIFDNYSIVNREIDPIDRGQAMSVGVTSRGLEGFSSQQAQGDSASVSWSALFDAEDFQQHFTDLFWAHENLRGHHASMLEAISGLLDQVRQELRSGAV